MRPGPPGGTLRSFDTPLILHLPQAASNPLHGILRYGLAQWLLSSGTATPSITHLAPREPPATRYLEGNTHGMDALQLLFAPVVSRGSVTLRGHQSADSLRGRWATLGMAVTARASGMAVRGASGAVPDSSGHERRD